MFVLQNGFYRFNDSWKQRDLGKLNGKEIEHQDTFEKDGRLYYRFITNRNHRLRSSTIQNKINDIIPINYLLSRKRINDKPEFIAWLNTLRFNALH